MAKYQKYTEYKDSAIKEIGVIPKHWDISKVKFLAKCLDGQRIPLNGTERGERSGTVPYWGANKIVDYVNDWIFDEELVLLGEDGAPFFDTTKDVAFAINGKIWPNNHVHVLRPNRLKVGIKYLTYSLNCTDYSLYISGSTRDKLNQSDMDNILIRMPSLIEQTQIANFLDYETAKIDYLIEKQQQLIELLKEKRQAVISHAVTKGLNPNVPMKDSGVEWLGEVPEHWDIKKIKYLGSILNGYAFPSDGFTEEGIKVLKISNIQTMYLDWTDLSFVNENQAKKLEQFLVKKGDLVFALTRPIISTGIKATLMDLDEKILLNQRNAILRPNGLCIQKWLYYMILNQNFVQEFNNQIDKTGQQPNISTVAIGNLEISVAPIEEQIKIVEFIAEKVERIDDLIKKAESAIQLMQERRTALISAAVTGKIDVRHWQAPNVTEADTELSA